MSQTGSQLFIKRETDAGAELTSCSLENLSFSGMCFSTTFPLEEKTTHAFQLQLREILEDEAAVTAEIRWVRKAGPSEWIMGAEFLKSDRGYLGPNED